MAKIQMNTGHYVQVEPTTVAALEETLQHPLHHSGDFTTFYTAHLPGSKQPWVIGKGYNKPSAKKSDAKQYVVWYPNGLMWSGYGLTFKEAIDGAVRDAWLNFNQ
jgi:hypothetical protein